MPFDNRPVELVRWLEKQPPDQRYIYASGNCLHAQFLHSLGRPYAISSICGRIGLKIEFIIAAGGRHTFGAALKRARWWFRKELRHAV